MRRLPIIEGLRAYLALWVIICHAMGFSGYDYPELNGLPKLLRDGRWAVELFMIVSGFVIFWLLDQKREAYLPFIIRRFFRLYPLYIVLLVVGFFISPLLHWETTHSGPYFTPGEIAYYDELYAVESAHSLVNLGLHFTMLHSALPVSWVGSAMMTAYVAPAWSISLEWQFYLIAPWFFWLVARGTAGWARWTFWGGSLLVVWFAHFGSSESGLLPYRYESFLIGLMSYFAFKYLFANEADQAMRAGLAPCCFALGIIVFLSSARARPLFPLCLWLAFFSLILGRESSKVARAGAWFFENSAAQFMGRISYGLYLSHWLILILVHGGLLILAPGLGQMAHFSLLLAGTLALSIAASAGLHHYVEVPGMEWGRKIAGWWNAKPA